MAWTQEPSALAAPRKNPPPPSGGWGLVSASRGTTPAPGFGSFLPVVKPAVVPKTLPAGIQPWGSVNMGDVSPFGSWGGDFGNEWTPAPVDYGAGAGGYGGGGGYSIGMDPGYQAALNAENLGVSQLDATLKAARERAVIDFGDPALADMAGFGLDPQAADFARQNYLSGNAALSRVDKARDLKRKAIIDALAGKGILFSGETGYQEGQAATEYGQNVYDTRNKVLDALRGYQQDYLDRKNSLHSQTVAAMQNAFAFAMANPGMYAGSGGGGGSGGGSGGVGFDPGAQASLAGQGYSADAVSAAARAYAAAHGGWGINSVKQEGTITYQNGRPGVYVKYNTPQGSSTEWTPI